MHLFENDYFSYRGKKLYCEDVSLETIANEVGTPSYIYSKNYMIDRFNEYKKAFESLKHKIFYACKANHNISIIKLFNELGAGIDVNSSGEFIRALKAGVDPGNIIFSGVILNDFSDSIPGSSNSRSVVP